MGKQWLSRNKLCFIVGVPWLIVLLAPFPGIGMIYSITDGLRGHPQRPHGTQPPNLVGLWIREESVRNDFLGQTFYLMPDGRFAGLAGMTKRRWHYDDDRFFIDSVSLCGNCYRGNVTNEYAVTFESADRLRITNENGNAKRGIGGNYRRVEITEVLKSDMNRLRESADESESFKGRTVLKTIEYFEALSDLKG